MSLEDWASNRWLRQHETSPQEIADLLAVVDRDITDAGRDVSADWSFGIAYNGALKLCTILLYASGYRAERDNNHYRTIDAMQLILGTDRRDDVAYLDSCRRKRNIAEYDRTDVATEEEAEELIEFTKEFREEVIQWLKRHHPHLLLKG